MGVDRLRVEEGEHLDVIGADPMAELKAKRPRPEGDELSRMTARALRAEGILAAIWRRLDDYRERGQAMPSYAELVQLLQG